MKAIRLRTDYRENPLGIDNTTPRFSWHCDSGKKQIAYRIRVYDRENTSLYDSGKVESDSMHCRYAGVPLRSRQRAFWCVEVWDESAVSSVSETAWFEMGLLAPVDWKAMWIAGIDTDRDERLAADCFSRRFEATKSVRQARLYATACGVYAPWINGKRLPGVLAPGTTQYDRRLHYQVYDVTQYIARENVLEIMVGDGWYKGKLGSSNIQCFFGNQTALLAQLELEYGDGTREIIGTDDTFAWCNDGPIRYSDLKDGEIYDARCIPSYGARAVCVKREIPLCLSPMGMITEHETFIPDLLISPSGAKILDFKQNLAGYIRFRPHGKPGQVIRLRMCETLDHGEYSNTTLLHKEPNIPSINQEILYTCSGANALFQPEFFYCGFRYALVEGMDTVDPRDFEAVAVYSELDYTAHFHCSNPMVEQFMRNTVWSQKSNFVDGPTDCPPREKSGWTGAAQIFAETASYFADTAAFYRKWLRDVRDCQREDGRIDNVCPKIRGVDERDVLNGASGWADAAVMIPYFLWKLYGDDTFICENYDLMHGWKEYAIKAAADKMYYHLPDGHMLKDMIAPYLLPDSPYNHYIIESGLHWGEWCEPDVDGGSELIRPKQELTSAYLHHSMSLLAEMLRAIGRDEEAIECDEYAQGAKLAYNHHFVKNGKIQAPRQAPMVRALALGLLDDETAVGVAKQLNEDVIARNYKVGTGFLSTPFVLGVLAKYGYVDSAYRLMENTEAPGWLAMVGQGATTVWENYVSYDEEGHPKMTSLNHYSPGAMCAFLFNTVCGIRVTGENRFEVKPVPGGTLMYADAGFVSPYGKIESGWKREGNQIHYTVTIPANTTARVFLPNGAHYEVDSGSHRWTV